MRAPPAWTHVHDRTDPLACAFEHKDCPGDRPAGQITDLGVTVLLGAPIFGAIFGLFFASPFLGFFGGGLLGASLVELNAFFAMRTSVCCEAGAWKTAQWTPKIPPSLVALLGVAFLLPLIPP